MWEVVGLNMWEVARLWSLIKPKFYQVGHATELTFKLLETSNFILQSRIAMVLWGIWKRQNEKLRNQVNTTPNPSKALLGEPLFARSTPSTPLKSSGGIEFLFLLLFLLPNIHFFR